MTWLQTDNDGAIKVTTGGGSSGGLPTGTILDFGGTTAPTGFVLADGSSLDTTTYADLFAVYGYLYGGAGSSFNVPDLRGRVPAGKDDMGGVAANRITGGTALGGSGGAQTHLLTSAESGMPSHQHGGTTGTVSGDHTHNFTYDRSTNTTTTGGGLRVTGIAPSGGALPASTGGITANHTHGFATDFRSANAASAHNNLQPYLLLNKIIKT